MAIESGGVAGQELSAERTVHVMKKERNTKMTRLGFTLTFLTVVCCSLFLGGCDRGKEQEALAEAAAARAALAKAQVAFAKSEKERNILQSELDAVIEERDNLQEQVKELTKERDEAVNKAKAAQTATEEDLMNQLTAQLEKVSELDLHVLEIPILCDLVSVEFHIV